MARLTCASTCCALETISPLAVMTFTSKEDKGRAIARKARYRTYDIRCLFINPAALINRLALPFSYAGGHRHHARSKENDRRQGIRHRQSRSDTWSSDRGGQRPQPADKTGYQL